MTLQTSTKAFTDSEEAPDAKTLVAFTEYVADNLQKNINYTEYLAENLDKVFKRLDRNSDMIVNGEHIENGRFEGDVEPAEAEDDKQYLSLEVFDTHKLAQLTELEQRVALTFLDAFLREGVEATFAFRLARKNLHALGLLIDQDSFLRRKKLLALAS